MRQRLCANRLRVTVGGHRGALLGARRVGVLHPPPTVPGAVPDERRAASADADHLPLVAIRIGHGCLRSVHYPRSALSCRCILATTAVRRIQPPARDATTLQDTPRTGIGSVDVVPGPRDRVIRSPSCVEPRLERLHIGAAPRHRSAVGPRKKAQTDELPTKTPDGVPEVLRCLSKRHTLGQFVHRNISLKPA